MPRAGSGPAAPHVLARGAVLLLLAGASATQTCAPWSLETSAGLCRGMKLSGKSCAPNEWTAQTKEYLDSAKKEWCQTYPTNATGYLFVPWASLAIKGPGKWHGLCEALGGTEKRGFCKTGGGFCTLLHQSHSLSLAARYGCKGDGDCGEGAHAISVRPCCSTVPSTLRSVCDNVGEAAEETVMAAAREEGLCADDGCFPWVVPGGGGDMQGEAGARRTVLTTLAILLAIIAFPAACIQGNRIMVARRRRHAENMAGHFEFDASSCDSDRHSN